ncbi:MAG: phosphoglycerate mutase family protein [Pyrinomonadaceae bacterium]
MSKQTIKPHSQNKSMLILITLLTILCAAPVFGYSSPSDQSLTTIIFIRHAEKKVEPDNPDPDLSPAGEARAQEIAKMFGDTGVNAIYATQFKRTQQTVKPLADKLGIPVTQVPAKNSAEVVKQIRAQHMGKVIFVAGHNNSVPEMIAALGGPKFPLIPETEFDNLYILTIDGEGKAKLIKLKYSATVK